MGMEGAELQNLRGQSQPSVAMEDAGAAVVLAMEGADSQSPFLEGTAGAGPQLVLAYQILIANPHHRHCVLVLVKKRKGRTDGADLLDRSLEATAGAGPQLVLAHQILIALRCQFALALMKRKATEGADLHDQSLEGMVGAVPVLAHRDQNLAHRQSRAKMMGMEGADLHEGLPSVAMEGAGAVMGMDDVDSQRHQNSQNCRCRLCHAGHHDTLHPLHHDSSSRVPNCRAERVVWSLQP